MRAVPLAVGKNSVLYLPAGSGGITSRSPLESLRHSGVQYLELFGGWCLALCEHSV
jgi:hypothetical protein